MKIGLIPSLLILTGCVALNPGADPLVVRTEQVESTTGASFDMVLHVDQSERGFWRTNAPAFHSFCEWLRTPVAYGGSNQPRCVAMQANVDDLKVAYKASKTPGSSNALWSAVEVLAQAQSQTVSWSNIITSPIHP